VFIDVPLKKDDRIFASVVLITNSLVKNEEDVNKSEIMLNSFVYFMDCSM
jgi:hypothetical protein